MKVYFRTKNVIQVTGILDPRCSDSEFTTIYIYHKNQANCRVKNANKYMDPMGTNCQT